MIYKIYDLQNIATIVAFGVLLAVAGEGERPGGGPEAAPAQRGPRAWAGEASGGAGSDVWRAAAVAGRGPGRSLTRPSLRMNYLTYTKSNPPVGTCAFFFENFSGCQGCTYWARCIY